MSSSTIQAKDSAISRWFGISDFKSAATNFKHHQWKAGAVSALKVVARVALVFAGVYALNRVFIRPATASLTPEQLQTKDVCEKFFAKGFEGRVACNECGWDHIDVPGLDPSKYSLVLGESSHSDLTNPTVCTAVLTKAGRALIKLSDKCYEVWKMLPNYDKSSDVSATLWWDGSAMAWY